MNGYLSGLCRKTKTFYTYNITYIQELLEYNVIKRFVFRGTNVVAAYINLNSARLILKLNKRCITHDPATHDTPSNGYLAIIALMAFIILEDLFRRCVNIKKLRGIWVNPKLFEFLKTLPAYDFLFAQLHSSNFGKNTGIREREKSQ